MAQAIKKRVPALNLLSLLMVIVGIMAITVPFFLRIHAETFVAVLLIGFTVLDLIHTVLVRPSRSLAVRELPNYISMLLALVAAGFLLFHPLNTYITFTTLIAAFIAVDTAVTFGIAMRLRKLWIYRLLLINGIVGAAIAILIWWALPGAALETIATLFGIYLVFDGATGFAVAREVSREIGPAVEYQEAEKKAEEKKEEATA